MREIKIDFDNPGFPQRLDVVENDAQSRFFKAVLYKDGKAYNAPDGATYSIMYRGFGPQNEGWYDTINDGAGKRAACSISGNVVTCEIARQALRVPGHVSVVLCVTGSNGYMLHGWPIDCNCRNDSYTGGTSVESFFYITQVTNADWTSAIQTWEELKNMIDPTLSVSGKAADAAKVGEAVNAETERAKGVEGQLKEDLGTPKSIKSIWFGAPYTCYSLSNILNMFATPSYSENYPFGSFVAHTNHTQGTVTSSSDSIVLRFELTNALSTGETSGLSAIIENNSNYTYNITINDDDNGAFGIKLYTGIIEKGCNIIPLANNAHLSKYLYMQILGTTRIQSNELNNIRFSLAKVSEKVYPNTLSYHHFVGAPYTCYSLSNILNMFATPSYSENYPFGSFVAHTNHTQGTVTSSSDSIVLRFELTNALSTGETSGLSAIIENNSNYTYNITINDDDNGAFGIKLYTGIIEKGCNIIPLANNAHLSKYLYMQILGTTRIQSNELNNIRFSLAKVPVSKSITPTPSENEQTVAFIGDSLTAQGYYTKMKDHLFKYNVYAIGGQAIAGILSRTNTIDLKITSPDVITNGAELTFVNGAPINNQGDGNIGTLTLNGNNFNIEYTSDDKVIAKNVSSSFANNGETIKTRICDTEFTLYVYWCGTNNMQGGHVDYFIQSFEQIIATHANSLILGITWDTSNEGLKLVQDIDTAATKKFGNRFLPLHDNVVKYGLTYNNLTPTTEDTEAINNNLIPPSLRVDTIHFNDYGKTYVAHLVQERMRTLGVK